MSAFASLLADFRAQLTPRVRPTLSTWAEQNFTLSSEYSARAGPLRLYGWQRGIFDAFTDPSVEQIVLMVAVQSVKSLFIQCALAYVICEDPGPVLIIEPDEDSARWFSKRRLAPMIRDCAALHGRLSTSTHDGNNEILSKSFPGGNLLLVSARTPIALAQHTIRYEFCDEVDIYKRDVGGSKEQGGSGDPIDLAWERAMTFGSRRKRIMVCSPTVAGLSRIGKAYAASDQRRSYAACPHCGERQVLRLRDKSGYRVRWDSSVSRERQHLTAAYYCIACDRPWTEMERWNAVQQAEWRASAPFAGIAGFWLNHFYMPPQMRSVPDIVQKFLDSKDDRQRLKTFINTVLAEEWQEEGVTPDVDVLLGRTERYPFGDEAIIPQRGLFLTAAVDVQDNPPRLEVETVAWGRGRENWSIDYRVIQAFAKLPDGTDDRIQPLPVTDPALWRILDQEVLRRSWRHASGTALPILAIAIDTGKRPQPVYEFARHHAQCAFGPAGLRVATVRTVIPVKGLGTPEAQLKILCSVSKEDAARKRQGVRIVGVGAHCAKQEIYDCLQHIRPNADGTPSPGCYHFPDYNRAYFESLTAEVRVVDENGAVRYEQRRERNEAIDLKVYNRAAAAVAGIDRFGEGEWRRLEQAVGTQMQTQTAAPAQSLESNSIAVQPAAPPPPVQRQIVQYDRPLISRPTRGGFGVE